MTSRSTTGCGGRSGTARRALAREGAAARRAEAAAVAGEAAASATSSGFRPGGAPGWRSCWTTAPAVPDGPRPTVLTADRQVKRLSLAGLPDAGRGARPGPGAEELQPPLAAVPPRPRVLAAGPRPARATERPPARAASAAADDDASSPGCGGSCGRTRCTAAPTARTTCAGRSAANKLRRDTDALERRVETRTNVDRPHLRPGLRRCSTSSATCARTASRCPPDGARLAADLRRVRPARRRVPARRRLGRPVRARSSPPAVSALVYESRRDDGAPSPRLPGGGGARGAAAETGTLWARLHDLEAEHRLTSCASPTPASPGPRCAGRPGTSLDRVLGRRPRRRRLRALDPAADRPARPDRRGRRRAGRHARARRRVARCAAAWSSQRRRLP